MGAPASNGKLCTNLSDMNIGDYIKCEYVASTAGTAGTFQNLGNVTLSELPTACATTANGYFYFIKAKKGLLIADRRLQNGICGQAINKIGYLTGIMKTLSNTNVLIRTLSRNEFIKYISNNDLNGNAIKADANVWHGLAGTATNILQAVPDGEICQDRSGSNIRLQYFLDGTWVSSSVGAYYYNSGTPMPNLPNISSTLTGSTAGGSIAWRPALEYVDNTKSTNLWY
jgi:hypothetical protein